MACGIIQVYPIFAFHFVVMYLLYRRVREQGHNGLFYNFKVFLIPTIKFGIGMPLYQYDTAAGSYRLQAGRHENGMIITIATQAILNGFHGSGKIFITAGIRYPFEMPVDIPV